MTRIALALAIGLALGGQAVAERLVTSLSTSRVSIGSNFTGDNLVLFGTVDVGIRAATGEVPRYDIVVTMRGPRKSFVTRRKERVLGLWINVDSREFVEAPSYLAVLANRTFSEIADEEVLRRERLGVDYISLVQRIGPDFADSIPADPFRQAFVRLKESQGLYLQDTRGVTFLTDTVFRASIPLPANVPTGTFEVETKLLASGVALARDATALTIDKIAFEEFVAEAARDRPFLYGLGAAAMALLTGWLASIVFRRD